LKHVLTQKAEKLTSKRVFEACFNPKSRKTYLIGGLEACFNPKSRKTYLKEGP
jgi:hypothetical protein